MQWLFVNNGLKICKSEHFYELWSLNDSFKIQAKLYNPCAIWMPYYLSCSICVCRVYCYYSYKIIYILSKYMVFQFLHVLVMITVKDHCIKKYVRVARNPVSRLLSVWLVRDDDLILVLMFVVTHNASTDQLSCHCKL